MNTETLEKMKQMRLYGMYQSFRTSLESERHDQLTADEMTSLLVESEWDVRHNRSIDRSTKNAHFRYKSTMSNWIMTVRGGWIKSYPPAG